MKDLFGNTKPVQIEIGEWWFNGRIIQQNKDFRLPEWISFEDNDESITVRHWSKKEAVIYAIENPCRNPSNLPKDYIGGN